MAESTDNPVLKDLAAGDGDGIVTTPPAEKTPSSHARTMTTFGTMAMLASWSTASSNVMYPWAYGVLGVIGGPLIGLAIQVARLTLSSRCLMDPPRPPRAVRRHTLNSPIASRAPAHARADGDICHVGRRSTGSWPGVRPLDDARRDGRRAAARARPRQLCGTWLTIRVVRQARAGGCATFGDYGQLIGGARGRLLLEAAQLINQVDSTRVAHTQTRRSPSELHHSFKE